MKKLLTILSFLFWTISVQSQTTMYLEASGTHYGANGTFSDWESTGSSIKVPTLATGFKQSTTIASTTIAVANASSTDETCFAQFVSPALAPQALYGTVTGYARMSVSSTSGCTAQSRIKIYVIDQTGAVKAVLLNITAGGSNLTTTLTSYLIANAAALTTYVCDYGDRLVIEIGIGRSAGTTARNGTVSFGSSSATNITAAGSTTANNPVVTFSNTLQFYQGSAIDYTSSLLNNLIAYWKFDENTGSAATDATGNGNNGQFNVGGSPATPTWATGKINYCPQYINDYDFFEVASLNNVMNYSAFSVETWVNFTSTANNARIVANAHTDASNLGFQLYISGGAFRFNVGNGTTNVSASNGASLSTGSWYHLLGVYDGANVTLYVNGSAGSPAALTGSMAAAPYNLWISGNPEYSYDFVRGYIDEVAIWNKALTQSETLINYNNGTGRQHPFN